MNKIIDLLKNKRVMDLSSLALACNLGENALLAQLEYLEKLGYLKKTVIKNNSGCKGCGCCLKQEQRPIIYWQLP